MTNELNATVMVVDDTLENLKLLQDLLGEQGYKVMAFPRGDRALQAAARHPPDLILLDIRMPEMDGYEVCRRLKADERLRDIPVLFISAMNEVEDKVRAFAQGGVDYVTKPFYADEVLARVEVHLRNRALERHLRSYNSELLQKQALLEDRLLNVEKMNSLSRISAGVAHEILNPINIISLELKMLLGMNGLSSKMRTELEVCMRHVRRIIAIADSLRQFSHSGKEVKEPGDINALIAHLLQLYSTQMLIENVKVVTILQPGLPPVLMNTKRIEQVLINIFSNALSAMDESVDKGITVQTAAVRVEDDVHVRLTIADKGPGIDKRNLRRVFDPFFTTKEQGKGTGMGLSIAHGIIREHGGRIRAESGEQGGAVFSIDLPEAQPEPEDTGATGPENVVPDAQESQESTEAHYPSQGGKT
ncbi:sensor histidine kinase [Desulfonatronovibrio magnus]|uniref:sensor histidine kinase n=1 Tax=Desulfonatronovibrio magnus TaxID=698827 RepID=UPI0005EB60EE|nr:response regulator [Desulfonatronovibrio magnus]